MRELGIARTAVVRNILTVETLESLQRQLKLAVKGEPAVEASPQHGQKEWRVGFLRFEVPWTL